MHILECFYMFLHRVVQWICLKRCVSACFPLLIEKRTVRKWRRNNWGFFWTTVLFKALFTLLIYSIVPLFTTKGCKCFLFSSLVYLKPVYFCSCLNFTKPRRVYLDISIFFPFPSFSLCFILKKKRPKGIFLYLFDKYFWTDNHIEVLIFDCMLLDWIKGSVHSLKIKKKSFQSKALHKLLDLLNVIYGGKEI